MLARMTLDDFEERADLQYVVKMCNKNLGEHLSDEICMQLATTLNFDGPCSGKQVLSPYNEQLYRLCVCGIANKYFSSIAG